MKNKIETDLVSIPEPITILPEIEKIIPADLISDGDNSENKFNNEIKADKLNNCTNSVISNNPDKNKQLKKRNFEIDQIKLKKTHAKTFESYILETGISSAFQLIFAELISKKIPVENHFRYTTGRLRSIGREIDDLKLKNK